MLIRIALLATLALTTACSAPMPLRSQQPALLQGASAVRTTNGALQLIEEMAHATEPAEFDRIEAAFRVEIAKSSRPSLQKIIKLAAEAIHHHPMPGGNDMDHPVVRLILASLDRYVALNNKNLMPRVMTMLKIIAAQPAQQDALIAQFQTSLKYTAKIDLRQILDMLNQGVFAELLPQSSPLHARFLALIQAQLAS